MPDPALPRPWGIAPTVFSHTFVDVDGKPLRGQVEIDGQVYNTDSHGALTATLPPGEYSYRALLYRVNATRVVKTGVLLFQ